MNSYFLIIMADILYAGNFALQKLYQKKAGTSLKAGLWFNGLGGIFSALMYMAMNKFELHISLYSVLSASIYAFTVMAYVILGFKVMEKGNVSMYSLFLMSGGMIVPYIWGVLFLDERLTIMRTIGLLVIVAAIVISNSNREKFDKKQLAMCIGIFLCNGITSVVTKIHQIHPVSEYVTTIDYSFLGTLCRAIMCLLIGLVAGKKSSGADEPKIKLLPLMPTIIAAAVLCGIGFIFQLLGSKEIPATILFPLITGGSVIFSTLAGLIIFKEKLSAKQWFGIALCFTGTLLFL